ncbi:DUF2231 domain-containing protein [bacterium]|nr:DUF2231 domain-containing protein [bacterium]
MRHPVSAYLVRFAVPILLLVVTLLAPSDQLKAQTNEYCPVTTSEKADPNIYLDYEDKRIHFCCNKCKRDFIADPDAYLANLKDVDAEPTSDKLAHYAEDAEREAAKASVSDDGHNHDHAVSSADSSEGATGSLGQKDHDDTDVDLNHGSGTEPDSDHDHATDHGESISVLGFLGKLHPVAVHFPIALIIMALIFVGTKFVLGSEIFDQMAAVIMYWAAFFAVVAALLGWARASGASFPSALEEYFEWHRLLGLASTGLTVLTALVAYHWRKRDSQRSQLLFRVLLVLNVVAIGVTGHLGATLVFGPNYYGL